MRIEAEQYTRVVGVITDEDGRKWVQREPTGKGRMTIHGVRVPFRLGMAYLRWRRTRSG